MTISAGTRLGPYEILSPIGAGGMGEVYRARDPKLQRDVAIKVLPQVVANDPETLARFEREALAVASLSHPNILSIFDFGNDGGVAYAVTELLEGDTLRGRLDAGPIPQKQALDYALQIARGLSAAHQKGVVHRDLKPENLFVTRDGHVKILDFGLAKKVGTSPPGEETSAPTVSGHTEPGVVMGTVGYMSPEQVRGLPVDHRSDIFSFGTILYELLSGQRAFKKQTAADTMSAILKEDPPEMTGSGPALDHIVRHCLEKDRENRFQSAKDVAFALGETSSFPVASGGRSARRGTRERRVVIGVWSWRSLQSPAPDLAASHRGAAAGESGEARRGASLREPGNPLGRLLRRRNCRCRPRQADAAPRHSGDCQGQLDPVSEDVEDVEADRPGARRRIPPHRHGALARGAGIGRPCGGQPGTRGGHRHRERRSRDGSNPSMRALTDVFQVQSDIATRVAQGAGYRARAQDGRRSRRHPPRA